jgi:hypothetical protein
MLGLSNGVNPDVAKAVPKRKRASGLKNSYFKELEAHLPAKFMQIIYLTFSQNFGCGYPVFTGHA